MHKLRQRIWTDNAFGIEGGEKIIEGLASNTGLTKLNLGREWKDESKQMKSVEYF